jgi:hypothetical protein
MHCSPLIGPPSAHWTTCTAAFRPPGRDGIPGRKHAASRRRIRRAPTLPGGRNALILNGLGLPPSSIPWVAACVAVRVFSSFRFSSRRLPRHDAIIEPTRSMEPDGYQGARPAEVRRLREFAVRRLPNPARRAVGPRFDWPGTFKTLSLRPYVRAQFPPARQGYARVQCVFQRRGHRQIRKDRAISRAGVATGGTRNACKIHPHGIP